MRRSAALILTGLSFFCGCCKPNADMRGEEQRPAVAMELPRAIRSRLDAAGWSDRVGDQLALWVSVERQALFGIEKGGVRFVYSCSTAAKGTGNKVNSNQTPLGWHRIDERIGSGLPLGAVFDERVFTGEVWTPDSPTAKDLILTRIMWLRGLEDGVNAGPGIDSHDRYIYIHGTPAEARLGCPASHGCIRLSNRHAADLFDRTAEGTLVLITDW